MKLSNVSRDRTIYRNVPLGITFKGPYLEYMSHGPQHVYIPQDRVGHSKTMFTGHHDYPAEDFMQDAGAITDRLILACKSIPICQEQPSNEPYHHGQNYQDLPDTMREWDMWVHGMYHEFVSDFFSIGQYNIMFSLALPLACHWEGLFTWPCCRELVHSTFSSYDNSWKKTLLQSDSWKNRTRVHELYLLFQQNATLGRRHVVAWAPQCHFSSGNGQ